MKKNAHIFYLLYLMIHFIPSGWSQNPTGWIQEFGTATVQYRYEHFSDKDGLIGGRCHSIFQDSKGYIWFGMDEGLWRYDGYSFERMNMDHTSVNEHYFNLMAGNLSEDSKGNIWGMGMDAVFKYDASNKKVNRYLVTTDPTSDGAIVEDNSGAIWVGSHYGLHKIAFVFPEKKDSAVITLLEEARVRDIVKDDQGTLWVGTMKGLMKIQQDAQGGDKLESIHRIPGRSDVNYQVIDLEKGKKGKFWVYGKIIYPEKADEVVLDLFVPKNTSFQKIQTVDDPDEDLEYALRMLVYDPDSEDLWLSGLGGAKLLKWEKPYSLDIKPVVLKGGVIINNEVLSIEMDHSGKLWVGTYRGGTNRGIFKIYPGSKKIKYHAIPFPKTTPPDRDLKVRVNTYVEDAQGNVWIGTNLDGFYKFDPSKDSFEHFYSPDTSIFNGSISNRAELFSDTKGNLWISGYRGLHQFHPERKAFSTYRIPEEWSQTNQVDRSSMFYIHCETREGQLWGRITTNSSWHHWIALKFDLVNKAFLLDSAIPDNYQHGKLGIDHQDNLWWGTGSEMGFMKIFPDSIQLGKVVKKKILGESVPDFIVDSSGMIWAGTGLNGIALIDPNKGLINRITEKEGLLSNYVKRIIQDDNGNLWVITPNGFSVYNPATHLVSNLNELEGLAGTLAGVFKHSSGHLYSHHDRGGFYVFHPDSIQANPVPPKISLTGLFTSIQKPDAGTDLYLNHPINDLSSLELKYFQNNLSIGYLGLHYDKPEDNEYAHMLENLNKDWVFVGKDRVARYPKLAPGKYVFKVKAANTDGVWSEPTSLKITIHPPWYWSWWSKLLYLLLVIGGLYYWIRSLQQRIKQKQDQLVKEQAFSTELKELNEANQRFVPQDFLQILGKESIKELHLGDQTQTKMTILFSDIRSYTTLSETMTPDDNFKFINGYLGRVGPIIKKHGGFIGQYLGDGFMALFLDNHQAAINAAIEIQKVLEDYNRQRKERGRQPIDTGIGLNTGQLMLGIIGDQNRYDSTVISDAVNTASRMEGLTKIFGAAIIISERTLQELQIAGNSEMPAISPQFAYRSLGKVKVKGKDHAVKIYDLYEGEIVAMRQLKAQTQKDFEAGIKHYFQRQFGKAAECFKNVLEENKRDKAAQYYLDKSVEYIVNDVPDGWSGVEEMLLK